MKFSAIALLSAAALVVAKPPGIPSEADARKMLSELKVAEPVDDGNYDRDQFPHWEPVPGETSCSAREYVLRRDGENVKTGSDCYPTSGKWTCPLDGKTWTSPKDISIDHMVPLKNAWISGANKWTTEEREKFANDIKGPQLWATTMRTNQDKSDSSPDKWKPPVKSFHCEYAASWVQVKSTYKLIVSAAEQAALEEMLGSCK